MDFREFYQRVGGDYDEAFDRMRKEERIKKFMNMFLSDPNYKEIVEAMEALDAERAFHAAHTLKGVAANLSLGNLQRVSSQMTEALRGASDVNAALPMLPQLKQTYEAAISAIEELERE